MSEINIVLANSTKRVLDEMLQTALNIGSYRVVLRIRAVLAVTSGFDKQAVASILGVSTESIRLWIIKFITFGPSALQSKKAPGRPARLTKSQKTELKRLLSRGPKYAGFPGGCWRSPMIQKMIHERFNVFFSVHYISQLLKNLGFSYQKACFTACHKDPAERKVWIEKEWPEIFKAAVQKKALILFGDEASFPQWGSLTYTWSKRGKQPEVKTSGTRKGYKVLGLIDYFSGRSFFKGHEGRLNSEIYIKFLKTVLSKTRKHIFLIQDGASYHVSKAIKNFCAKYSNRITICQLPTYSPDYNPIEKLWKKIKEKEIHLHYFPTFDSLKKKVEEALIRFENAHDEVLSLFGKYNRLASNITT